MHAHERILNEIAGDISRLAADGVRRIAVDGVDGAGKTDFADALARVLVGRGQHVIRAGVDGFHNPPGIRYRAGWTSPMGYFRDSYDYTQLKAVLLDPLSRGGSRHYRHAVYDVFAEQSVSLPEEIARDGSILVFDGIFLHRPQLRGYWDYSIYLDVDFEISVPRGARRGYGDPDPNAQANRRYVDGQRLYLRECAPRERATVVIGYNDLVAPFIRRAHPQLPSTA